MSERWLNDIPIDGANAITPPHSEGEPMVISVVRNHQGMPHVQVRQEPDGTLSAVQRLPRDRRCVGGEPNELVIELDESVSTEITDETLEVFGEMLRAIEEQLGQDDVEVRSDVVNVDRSLNLTEPEGDSAPVVEIHDGEGINSHDDVR